jgi:soluble lytic murein transglycosylase-like protein
MRQHRYRPHTLVRMMRLAGPWLACALALCATGAHAQAGATPPAPDVPAAAIKPADAAVGPADAAKLADTTGPSDTTNPADTSGRADTIKPADTAKPADASKPADAPGKPGVARALPTADDICRTVEQAAADNGLPVEFFARVIWQESRFNALAVSNKGAEGIAQFMPQTASWHGLADPFDPIEALRHSASYLRELRDQFGNLGLAAAAYNAGPGRIRAWLASHGPLPGETRNYVAVITGWTIDDWASPSPPENAEITVPQGVPCTRLANLILAPKAQAQRIVTYVPRWGAQLTSNWSESRAWATYRSLQKQYASLIGDREPIVLRARLPGMGAMARTIIRIADDNRAPLDKLCAKLIAAGGACVVLRNSRG